MSIAALITPAFREHYKSIFLYLILFFPHRIKIFMSAVGQEESLRNFKQYFSVCILVTMKLRNYVSQETQKEECLTYSKLLTQDSESY